MWTNTDGMQRGSSQSSLPLRVASPLRTSRGKPYTHQETVNTGNWASKQKNIYTPSHHWHSLAQWFVPKYKISWKAITAPNGESYITLPTNSIFLLSKRMSTGPQLDIWASGSSLDTQQGSSMELSSPWALGFLKMFKQTKTATFLFTFRTFPMTLRAPTWVTLDLQPPWVL